MADLVDGRYPQTSPLWTVLGQQTNVAQSDIPARTNAEFLGLSTLTDGAIAASGVATFVPIPIDVGTVVSKVTIQVGATAASTPTHSFAAIYSGIATPAKIVASADALTAPIAASAAFSWTLSTPTAITSAQAPNGFIYAGISVTGTATPTAAGIATPTAVGYQWNTNGPLFFAASAGSALNGVAAATIASPSAVAVSPIIIVT